MSKKIVNENYRKFLDEGVIDTISEEQLRQALNQIKGKNSREARALLIALYYTGARPNEILSMKAKDVTKEKNSYIKLKIKGSKGGLTRTIPLSYKNDLVREIYSFATATFPEMLLFYNFIGRYERTVVLKDGSVKKRIDTTTKLRYHVSKWFEGIIDGSIPPYFLRHNRFSKLAEAGVEMSDIRLLKGAKSMESVTPYIHLSSKKMKKITRYIK